MLLCSFKPPQPQTTNHTAMTKPQTPPPTPHLDKLESLIGLPRGQYYAANAKAIRKDISRRIDWNRESMSANPSKRQ
jgi:hypothetical protein